MSASIAQNRFTGLALSFFVFSAIASGCGKAAPVPPAGKPGADISTNGSFASLPASSDFTGGFVSGFGCPRGIVASPSWKAKSREEILDWLGTYGAYPVQDGLSQEYLAQFAAEFERIPEIFRVKTYLAGGSIHLLQGMGVTEDPSWGSGTNTFDGRAWSTVPGSGGSPYLSDLGGFSPTRFVINRLYEGHGSVNLVIHEFAHSLDSMSKQNGFSALPEWVSFTQDNAAFRAAIGSLCGTYCTEHTPESFAESVAVYYSCDQTRNWFVQKAPEAAAWIGSLPSKL